ncbi:MAG: hypothetical protein ACHQPI_03965 [Thermoanaerobaculia bacterium]
MRPPNVLEALAEVAAAFAAGGIRWYVGGSVASSARGVARASLDVDVIADLRPEHVASLAAKLRQTCYVSEDAIRDAIRRRTGFNVVHLPTALKIDVFVPQDREFDRAAFQRAALVPLDSEASGLSYPVASSEDVILAKLEWFRAGGEVSERQWGDLLGVLRISGPTIDRRYLDRMAASLGLSTLLERAVTEAQNKP